jgi:hypothetical protein
VSWGLDRERDRMVGHDFPGVCGPGMHDYTLRELELGARAAYELVEVPDEESVWDALDGIRWESGEHPMDRGGCPYYRYFLGKGSMATCGGGCHDEPEGGWPSARIAGLYDQGVR